MSGEGAQPQAIRKLAPGKLVIASHNEGKVREIGALLAPHGLETVSAKALGLPEPDETAPPFVSNSELKAPQSAAHPRPPALPHNTWHVVDAPHGEAAAMT